MKHKIQIKTNMAENICDMRLSPDKAVFKVNCEKYEDASFSLIITFETWQQEDYMFMPACAYNGNRFKSVERKYPPMFLEEERGVMPPVTITDVPRLDKSGKSKLEVTTGDLATPAVGLYSKKSQKAILIYTTQGREERNFGICFEESNKKALLTVSYPVRREKRYFGNRLIAAEDLPLCVYKGDVIEIPYKIISFECQSIHELYKVFFETRKCMGVDSSKGYAIPFSKGWEIQEDKFNLYNYRENGKYYGVGTENSKYQDWQVGWVGGGISTYALLMEGNLKTRERAYSTLDFMFEMQSQSGFFYGIVNNGLIFDDGFDSPHSKNFHLIRKSADALYFVFKHFHLISKRKDPLKETWTRGARKGADGFCEMWKKYGQWGQFIEVETGEIIVGNSTSAAIAPAALALAYDFFGDKTYLETAEAAAEYYYTRDVCKGYMTGGPGEILQCPDSESSFGMLESFIVLYEMTGSKKWLSYAENTACQCASWCVSYNYIFPENSEFRRLDIKTVGSVFANIQNKHSAPGICTLSGNSLFKLFRATGKEKYLELMCDMAGFLIQCMSRDDRPVYSWDSPPEKLISGFICERVNMSDWEGPQKVGGVFNGSCWSEVSQMLTFAEIPGVYVVSDMKLLKVIDHVHAHFNEKGNVVIENPSEYPVTVKVMIENSNDLSHVLGVSYEDKLIKIDLDPMERKVL